MKTGNRHDTQEQKENLKNTRNALKILQKTASDKENLVGRVLGEKDKLATTSFKLENKHRKLEDKAVQTGECVITAADLTSDEPSADYWKKLAEKRQEMLDESFQENERLKETIETLKTENSLCNAMLDESRALIEVLQEMLGDEANTTTEVAEEATEEI